MDNNFDVIALGELLIDFTENGFSANRNPLLEANPGGAPCNVLSMLQKLGRKTAFIGKVGQDSFGEMLVRAVREQGIDTGNLSMDREVPTTLAFVHTAEDGDRSFSFYRNPGADMRLRENDIDFSVLKKSKIFHFGTLSMTDEDIAAVTMSAIDKAKEESMLISFDPNIRPLLWKDMNDAKKRMEYGISKCDILKISDDEIIFFTGLDDVEHGARQIMDEYHPRLITATAGKNGSLALYKDMCISEAPFLRDDTIETTGAGDTFMACVLNYVLEHDINDISPDGIREMLTFANAAASIITSRKGALRVMPDKYEVEEFIRERNR
jgi:fructokinase